MAGFSCNFIFARPRSLFSLWVGFVSNIRRKMLFYSILQSLGSASYVARITLWVNSYTTEPFLCFRNAVLLNGWKGLLYYKQHVGRLQRNNLKWPVLFGFQNVGNCHQSRVVLDRQSLLRTKFYVSREISYLLLNVN